MGEDARRDGYAEREQRHRERLAEEARTAAEPASTVGGRVRRLRHLRRMTQQELADTAGLSGQQTVQQLETRVAPPRPRTLRALAAALGVTVADLVRGTER